MDNLFADFVSKFIKKLNEDNLKYFYNLFFVDKSVGKFNFSEHIRYRARIVKILLEKDCSEDKRLLLEVLHAIEGIYHSLNIVSKRTLLLEEDDDNPKIDIFGSGELINYEFNKFFAEFFQLFEEYRCFYKIDNKQIIVKYFNSNEKFFETCHFELLEKNKKVYIIMNKVIKRIKSLKSLHELYKPKGWEKAVTIHKDLINTLPKHKEECVWCNPVVKTKHKCPNCIKLNNLYNNAYSTKALTKLPKDLNQIIKRIKQKYSTNIGIKTYRRFVADKLIKIINSAHDVTNSKKNKSALLEAINQAFLNF